MNLDDSLNQGGTSVTHNEPSSPQYAASHPSNEPGTPFPAPKQEAPSSKEMMSSSDGQGALPDEPAPETPTDSPEGQSGVSEPPTLPFQVFYNSSTRRYLVQNGSGQCHELSLGQLQRKLRIAGVRSDEQQDLVIDRIEHEFNVDYAAPLAGRKKGFYEENGSRILVTNSPKLIRPVPGVWGNIRTLIENIFVRGEPLHGEAQWNCFLGWLKLSLEALLTGLYQQAQVMVIAGEPDAGKSLLQHLITECLGGRSAKSARYMQGKTQFNAELFEAEHLILEDEDLDTSPKARRKLGASFKSFTVSAQVQSCHRKGKTAINLRAFWRVSMTLNDEPQALRVLPPLDQGIADKMMLLKASKFPMPMPLGSVEERAEFRNQLQSELPAFLHWLLNDYQVLNEWKDSRFGVATWHHPELKAALESLSDELILLAHVDEMMGSNWPQPFWEGTAQELRLLLRNQRHITREVRSLLHTAQSTGTFLGLLSKKCPERVQSHRLTNERKWRIYPPGDAMMPASNT